MQATFGLTDEQMDRLIQAVEGAVHRAVLDSYARARDSKEVNHHKAEKLEQRIIRTLEQAPAQAEQHPALAHILAVKAMPKTLLRKRIGNGAANFDAVLVRMATAGQLIQRRMPGAKGRYLQVFGLP